MRRFAALLPVLWCGLALPASAAWVLVDDFSGSSPGPLTGQSSALGTTWSAPGVYSVIADPTNPGNQVLQANMGANSGNRWAFLPLGTQEIADGTSGTLFFRYRREGAVDANIGLTDVNSPGGFGDYRVQLNTQTDDPSDFQLRNGGSFNTLDSPSFDDGTWYHVWMTADNAADTFHVHILDAGTGAGVEDVDMEGVGGVVRRHPHVIPGAVVEGRTVEGVETAAVAQLKVRRVVGLGVELDAVVAEPARTVDIGQADIGIDRTFAPVTEEEGSACAVGDLLRAERQKGPPVAAVGAHVGLQHLVAGVGRVRDHRVDARCGPCGAECRGLSGQRARA